MASLVSSSLLLWLRYSFENGLKKMLKWIQNGLKSCQNGSLEASGGTPGGVMGASGLPFGAEADF